MGKKVTLRDISERIGVSPATVSNVLNGRRERVSPETAQAVLQAVEELGYHPNSAFQALSTRGHSETIGLIVASVLSPLFTQAVAGVETAAGRFGFSVILCNNRGNEGLEANSTDLLLKRNVAGIIFVSSSSYRRHDALEAVIESKVPFIIVNRLTDPTLGLHILVENEQGTYHATEHLIGLGHTDIACIHLPTEGPTATLAGAERLRGFRRALHAYNLNEVDTWIRPGVLGEETATAVGYRTMHTMLTSDRQPSAVICGTDQLAVGAMHAALDLGLRIPEDLAIVGHDDTPGSLYVRPSLSSVSQPMRAVGERAAEALIQHLWKGMRLQGVERLPCRLVARESSVGHIR